MKVSTALLSLSDKSNIAKFSKALQKLEIEIIATSGTADYLEKQGIHVEKVSEMTGCKEILDGKVKTLNRKIHGAILANKNSKAEMSQIKDLDMEPIDLVVIDFYPIEKKIEEDNSAEKVLKNFDIGGPALVRSCAKNFQNVAVVIDSSQYGKVLKELEKNDRKLSEGLRKELAATGLSRIVEYNEEMAKYFDDQL